MARSLLASMLVAGLAIGTLTTFAVTDACGQATCRAKCTEEEQACLQRTGNKGQCGTRASECLAKCK